MSEQSRLISLAEASRLVGVSRQALSKRVQRGTLKGVSVDVGGRQQVQLELNELLLAYPDAQPQAQPLPQPMQPQAQPSGGAGEGLRGELAELREALERTGEAPSRALTVLADRHRSEVAELRQVLERTQGEVAEALERERRSSSRSWGALVASSALIGASVVWGLQRDQAAVHAASDLGVARGEVRTLEASAGELRGSLEMLRAQHAEASSALAAVAGRAERAEVALEVTLDELRELRRAEVMRLLGARKPQASGAPFSQ